MIGAAYYALGGKALIQAFECSFCENVRTVWGLVWRWVYFLNACGFDLGEWWGNEF